MLQGSALYLALHVHVLSAFSSSLSFLLLVWLWTPCNRMSESRVTCQITQRKQVAALALDLWLLDLQLSLIAPPYMGWAVCPLLQGGACGWRCCPHCVLSTKPPWRGSPLWVTSRKSNPFFGFVSPFLGFCDVRCRYHFSVFRENPEE